MVQTFESLFGALGSAQASLLQSLKEVEESVRSRSDNAAQLRQRLCVLREQLLEHFRFEEENGYMEAVRSGQPNLERTIQNLLDEHQQLAESLDALIAEAATVPSHSDEFADKVLAWIQRSQSHEASENELLQSSFNLDLGSGD